MSSRHQVRWQATPRRSTSDAACHHSSLCTWSRGSLRPAHPVTACSNGRCQYGDSILNSVYNSAVVSWSERHARVRLMLHSTVCSNLVHYTHNLLAVRVQAGSPGLHFTRSLCPVSFQFGPMVSPYAECKCPVWVTGLALSSRCGALFSPMLWLWNGGETL